jgi:organic radical activating enzyme
MKIHIPDLIIEITRNCNMECMHCLRGEKQDIDMDLIYIEILFNRIESIGSLTLTGGEPSLKPNIIKWIILLAKRYNIDIGNFYIVTNGKKIADQFLIELINLYLYCSDNEISSVKVSHDDYHEYHEEGERLKVFSFVQFQEEEKTSDYPYHFPSWINEGKAKENGIGEREISFDDIILNEEGEEIEEGNIYLNCKGNIIKGCDYSYTSQDKEENIICKVENFSLESIKAFIEKKGALK